MKHFLETLIKKGLPLFSISLLLMSSMTVSAQSMNIAKMNDVKFNENQNSFSVIGDDPFFIFKLDSVPDKNQYFLNFDIEVNQEETQMQLFFNQVNGGFDPYYFINFTVSTSQFSLKLPDYLSLNSNQVRLDINQCLKCTVKINKLFISSEKTNLKSIEASLIKNGLNKISDSKGLDLNDIKWELNHLNGRLSSFVINGQDPYFSSSILEVPTDNLGGVYFKIKHPQPIKEEHHHFELFYTTQNNRYDRRSRSVARVNLNQSKNNPLELFFPLDFFDQKVPTDQVLKRIRLDLPLYDGKWSVSEVKLVHSNQFSTFKKFIPQQLIQQKRHRIKGSALLKHIFSNIWQQKGFLFLYFLLILLVSGLFVRAFKK